MMNYKKYLHVVNMKTNKGFTLIELLVVISIISLMSSISLAALSSARTKARDAVRIQEIKALQGALELYALNHDGEYPLSNTAVISSSPSFDTTLGVLVTEGYIPTIPHDPINSTSDFLLYGYGTNSNTCDEERAEYVIFFNTENPIEGFKTSDHPLFSYCLSNNQ